jgi:hypothetical protein
LELSLANKNSVEKNFFFLFREINLFWKGGGLGNQNNVAGRMGCLMINLKALKKILK